MSYQGLLENVARSGIEDRVVETRQGLLILSADRRRAYRVPEDVVVRLDDRFAAMTATSRGQLRRGFQWSFPFAFASVWLITMTGLGDLIDTLGGTASLLCGIIAMAGLPLLLLHRHFRAARRAHAEIDTLLKRFPAAMPSAPDGGYGLDRVEKVTLTVMAPHIIGMVGWLLGFATFRDIPPWTAALLSGVTLALIATLTGPRLRRRRRGHPDRGG